MKLSRRNLLVGGAAVGAAGLLARTPGVASATTRPSGSTALTHVTVIDPGSGRVLPDMTVVIRDGRIRELGRSREMGVPAGVAVVDLRGRFIIPGLCDMHIHSAAEQIDPPLYVANGVTTVREMMGQPRLFDWRRRIEEGSLLGPQWIIGSQIVDGSPSLYDNPEFFNVIEVADEAQGRQAVRQVVREGADFVKVYSRVPRSAFHGIADEARRHGVPFVGHCPDEVDITEASDLGMGSLEHLWWTFFATSRREKEIRAEIAQKRFTKGDYNGWFNWIHTLEWKATNTYRPRQGAGPLQPVRSSAHPAGADAGRALRDRLRPAVRPQRPAPPVHPGEGFSGDTTTFWRIFTSRAARPSWTRSGRRRSSASRPRSAVCTGPGVPIMTGTDTGTSGVYPGFAVHDELRLLVQAGLPAMAALEAATAEPARFLGTADRAGSVARGKVADLVILGANPLEDISNTQKIDGVVVRGRYIDSAERTEILRKVEEAAAGSR